MSDLPPVGPVLAGQICDPNNIPDADAATAAATHLACQLTNVTGNYEIPGQFLNALKGDVVLSPANGSLIGNLLMSLSPAQYHSHSGIMTDNFRQITHCTASQERIGAFLDTDILGIPTRFKPEQLQYLWPGSITQTVDESIAGAMWRDPQMPNKTYNVSGFVPEDQTVWDGGRFVLIHPLVVKPLPEQEGSVRARLHAAADIAITKGGTVDSNGSVVKPSGCYYSFYAYTMPEIARGFGSAAGPDAHWAQGASPAVCSSFVWLCMKQANIPLVTANQYEANADFTPDALAAGASAMGSTLDGLCFYSQTERTVSGTVLHTQLASQIKNQEGAFASIPIVGDSVASSLADQLANMFAFGNPDMAGKSDWQNPGIGNAVSPDDITFWKTPNLGYVEPLQFLAAHTEQYTLSRWVAVTQYGTISGTVSLNGLPVNGAQVWMDDKYAYTDSNGHYSLSDVAYGNYNIHASVTQGTFFYSAVQGVAISAVAQVLDIGLVTSSADFRTVEFALFLSCDHGDANPFHTHGVQYEGPITLSTTLSPWQVTGSTSYSFDYDGGGYFNVQYRITSSLASDLSVSVEINVQIWDDGGGLQVNGTPLIFNVPAGQQHAFTMTAEADGFSYHNGPAVLTGVVTNAQT